MGACRLGFCVNRAAAHQRLKLTIGSGGAAQLAHVQPNDEGYAPPCQHKAGWRNEGLERT
jgi:hypothetical protein